MSPTLRRLRYAAHPWLRRATGRLHGMQRVRSGEPHAFPGADYSLHMLLCHRDLEMALWSLKSFSFFAQASPAITIHDDGTLTLRDIANLERLITRCRVIPKSEADTRMRSALSRHPHSQRARELPWFYCASKLFDPWVYASTERIVLLDSDVLFFRRPDQLIRCALGESACYMADYQDSYSMSVDDMQRDFGVAVHHHVNAGMLVLSRSDYDLDWIEAYFARFPNPVPDPNRHEQTLYAMLLSRANALRLGPDYQISQQPICETTVSHHFVNDGSRLHFSTRGLRTLRERGTFDAIVGRRAS